MKKGLIVSKLLRFSRQEWIQKIKLFKCYTEKDKHKNWTDLSLLGQEPTFKVMSGRSVYLTTPFLGRLRPPKRLTSTSCTYFRR